jgi:hypothetical protein
MEKTTSSAVKSLPSWNLTPFLRLKTHTVGLACFQVAASEGTISRFLPRVTRGSYTWPLIELVSSSFCACGSAVTWSPWLDQRSVFASAIGENTRAVATRARSRRMVGLSAEGSVA